MAFEAQSTHVLLCRLRCVIGGAGVGAAVDDARRTTCNVCIGVEVARARVGAPDYHRHLREGQWM